MTLNRTLAGILVLAGFLSFGYGSSLNGALVLDDRVHLQADALKVRSFSFESFRRVLLEAKGPERPVANLSFGLNHSLFGPSLPAYHAVNILLHALNAVLLFFLARRIFSLSIPVAEAAGISAAAALLWAVHPIHPNTVTYMIQRMTLLAALFLLLAVLSGARAGEPGRRREGWFTAAAAFSVLGILSKQIAITAPLSIALLHIASGKGEEAGWRRSLLWGALGTALLAGIYAAYLWLVLGTTPAAHATAVWEGWRLYTYGPWERTMTQWRVLWFYAGLVLWPTTGRIALEHDLAPSVSLISPPTTLLSLLGILGLIAAAVLAWRRFRPLSFLILWYVGNLALESSFLPLDQVFEHRAYLPSFGIIGAVLYLLYLAVRSFRWGRWCYLVMVVVAASLLSVGTRQVNATFASERTLWEDVVRKSPGNGRAWFSLGWIDYFEGRRGEAERNLREAVRLSPNGVHERVMLGNVLAERGNRAEALRLYREALRLAPQEPAIHYNLSSLYEESGNREEAIRHRESYERLSGGRGAPPAEKPFEWFE